MKKFVILLSAAAALSTLVPGTAFARCDDCRVDRPTREFVGPPADKPTREPIEKPARDPGDKPVIDVIIKTIKDGASLSPAGVFTRVFLTPSKIGCGPNELCN